MANNKTKKTVNLNRSFFAFWGMVLAALAIILGGIFAALNLGIISTVLMLIGQIAIAIAIIPSAWSHVANRNIAYKLLFVIAVIVYVVGCVLGVL